MIIIIPAMFGLVLNNGQRWRIGAGDIAAQQTVAGLVGAMQLQLADNGRELLAVTAATSEVLPFGLDGEAPIVCFINPPDNNNIMTIDMIHLSLAIARQAQRKGGILLHGALAEYQGRGVVLAGPGMVGKSTASRRLPPPWRSLCDDTTLVVRDTGGRYWAHPWPTWSRFFSQPGVSGPGGSWDVQSTVPLGAVFFLRQAPHDWVEPVNMTQTAAMLMESVEQGSRGMTRGMDEIAAKSLRREQLINVQALAAAVPAFILQISLSGEFWKEIERELNTIPGIFPEESERITARVCPLPCPQSHRTNLNNAAEMTVPASLAIDGGLKHERLRIVYNGPSMNPTLREPDLLEVRPYDARRIQTGDVVYFRSPSDGQMVVHRVVAVYGETGGSSWRIRTRGDHNTQADSFRLSPSEIVGQVTAAQHGGRQRRVAGGWPGRVAAIYARLWRRFHLWLGKRLHAPYQTLAKRGLFQCLLPARLRPQVFAFHTRQKTYLKLMLGNHLAGYYEPQVKAWRIRRPYRLFVDERQLPFPPDPKR